MLGLPETANKSPTSLMKSYDMPFQFVLSFQRTLRSLR
ncbi:unnamed protein product, partial [Allacma fusca]